MPLPPTAYQEGIPFLYHWQPFQADRLATILRTRTIYCSSPSQFNDPWDCKPHFNTSILNDPVEREKHVQWASEICRTEHGMAESDILSMQERLRKDVEYHGDLLSKMSAAIAPEIDARYRVYCMGPDVCNLLMWAHYAKDHTGVCLEFRTDNEVICAALKCQYMDEFPLLRAYSRDDSENLAGLLAKSSVWEYESEYRLIAEEREKAMAEDSLKTDGHLLLFPEGALRSIIVGCQGDFEVVRKLVADADPQITVKRAVRIPNRYQLRIIV